jgi:hypothetical protein
MGTGRTSFVLSLDAVVIELRSVVVSVFMTSFPEVIALLE